MYVPTSVPPAPQFYYAFKGGGKTDTRVAGAGGAGAFLEIPHELVLLPLSLSPLLTETSLIWTPQKPCVDCLLRRPDIQGAHLEQWGKRGARCGGILCSTRQNHCEKLCRKTEPSVVNTTFAPCGKALRCISLIKPPAAPTSNAGPAYRDLRAAESGQSQSIAIRTGQSGSKPQVPEAKERRGADWIYFSSYLCLRHSTRSRSATGN